MKNSNSIKKRLVILSAPSGAGKTTLALRLIEEFSEQMVLSISSTTRAPRGKEVHGKHYFFISKEQFEADIKSGKFAEYAEVHGNYYGTSKQVVDSVLAAGKVVVLDIDVQGAASLRKAYPQQTLSVFISPPDLETLEERLRARGTESEERIRQRIRNGKVEMERMGDFENVIINDTLEHAYQELRTIVLREVFSQS